ncbi:MAG: outer membrane beta-barrel protein [Rhodospirillales bacterium]|nr:outer membrane beta-barrel protein [Rhodospirillales bacterium]
MSCQATQVMAQAAPAGAVGQPQQREERPDVRSPAVRESETYDAKGVRLGGFKFFGTLEADEVFNDNINASSNAVGKQAAFIQLISPTLELKSDWNNHMLNAYAKGGFGLYSVNPGLNNYQDVSIGADGRVDIQRNWNVYGGASWNRRHDEFGTPNTPTGVGLPVTVYNQTSANVGYFQAFNRLNVRIDGRYDNYNFFNNGLGPGQGVIPNSDRNRDEWREALRFGYEFSPGYEVWVRGSFNQRRYFQLDTSGLDRSSNGFDVVGGMVIDLGGITAVEVFAGYLQQTYVSGQFASISTPTFGLVGYWNPIRDLWVKPFIRRTVDDSAFTGSAAYLSTTGGLDVNYHVRPNIRLDAHADYAIADYSALSTGGTNQYDQYLTFRAGLMYLPTANFFVGPVYQFINRTSNQFNGDYNQNVVMLRLGAKL